MQETGAIPRERMIIMKKIRVGVAGYGTIGQRLADGVAMQEDMELVGIADLAPTLRFAPWRKTT